IRAAATTATAGNQPGSTPMSTKLQEFMKVAQKLKEQMAELEKMKKSKPVQKELQFKDDLEKLMKKHGKSYQDLGRTVQMMASGTSQTRSTSKAPTKRTRAPRKLKVYLTPYNGARL
ncbi:MAG: hypothetical protein LAT81_16440, partial [Oceanicaulis sp.]|nr:hypothetical protein [Oceanicaulis sp.]